MVKLIEEHDGIKPPPYTGVPRDFVLTIPSSEVATTAVAGSSDNSCRRSKPRKPTKVATAGVAGVATNIDHSSDNCCRTEHWNTEGTLKGGAFSAPRTEYVDRDGDLSKENPVSAETNIISAPDGADAIPVERKGPERITPEQIESLAAKIAEPGFNMTDIRPLVSHLNLADRAAVIERGINLRQQRAGQGAAA